MSTKIIKDVLGLVEEELKEANEKFPLFNSNHEAYAVLLEEIEEAREELLNLEIISKNIWDGTKGNYTPEALREQYTEANKRAINLAVEAIQCAAMARKSIMSNIEMLMVGEK